MAHGTSGRKTCRFGRSNKSVKTSNNILKRTITKIAPLPLKRSTRSSLITVLLCAFSSMLNTTEAHNFSFFENNQRLENKQNFNVELKQSESFALILIIGIVCVCFFLFLMYLFYVLYKGALNQTSMSAENRQEKALNEKRANHTKIELHSNIASNPTDVSNMYTHS